MLGCPVCCCNYGNMLLSPRARSYITWDTRQRMHSNCPASSSNTSTSTSWRRRRRNANTNISNSSSRTLVRCYITPSYCTEVRLRDLLLYNGALWLGPPTIVAGWSSHNSEMAVSLKRCMYRGAIQACTSTVCVTSHTMILSGLLVHYLHVRHPAITVIYVLSGGRMVRAHQAE